MALATPLKVNDSTKINLTPGWVHMGITDNFWMRGEHETPLWLLHPDNRLHDETLIKTVEKPWALAPTPASFFIETPLNMARAAINAFDAMLLSPRTHALLFRPWYTTSDECLKEYTDRLSPVLLQLAEEFGIWRRCPERILSVALDSTGSVGYRDQSKARVLYLGYELVAAGEDGIAHADIIFALIKYLSVMPGVFFKSDLRCFEMRRDT